MKRAEWETSTALDVAQIGPKESGQEIISQHITARYHYEAFHLLQNPQLSFWICRQRGSFASSVVPSQAKPVLSTNRLTASKLQSFKLKTSSIVEHESVRAMPNLWRENKARHTRAHTSTKQRDTTIPNPCVNDCHSVQFQQRVVMSAWCSAWCTVLCDLALFWPPNAIAARRLHDHMHNHTPSMAKASIILLQPTYISPWFAMEHLWKSMIIYAYISCTALLLNSLCEF